MTASRVTYKDWAGILIKGTTPVPVPNSTLHVDRAAYLATSLESPKLGTVQSYDRCAMSGGPFHFTAIQPGTMTQGSLFQLLRHLEVTSPCAELTALWNKLKTKNWYVARDGYLRNINTGALVSAVDIRNEFTPDNGVVPADGPKYQQAVEWANLFSALLSSASTIKGQSEFAIDYLLKGQRATEAQFYDPFPFLAIKVGTPNTTVDAVISVETDLAMCVYHAHSVNAPGPAATCLKKVLAEFPSQTARFSSKAAAYLIWLLGTTDYGAWHDTKDGKNRYDNTRNNAMRCGLWPQALFVNGSMPVDLPTTRPANTLP